MVEFSRTPKPRATLVLPPCPIPRPGEEVTWFEAARRESGVLTGHTGTAQPIVRGKYDREYHLQSFQTLRVVDPFKRRGPVWDYLPDTSLWEPAEDEIARFEAALSTKIPPGHGYIDLIEEIWSRGFEVFLVGGTVRDILAGEKANDVDLVTSMPLALALDVLRPMFRNNALNVQPHTGFCRLGGTPASGDPFIDLKMVCLDNLGTPNAQFGADLSTDVAHRDFACNALYYDPKNKVIIDPSGSGLADVQTRKLTLVSDRGRQSSVEAAKMAIRFFKFVSRGYAPADSAIPVIRERYVLELASMPKSQLIGYTRTQILAKHESASWPAKMDSFRQAMSDLGYDNEWARFFAPVLDDLSRGAR